MLIIFFINNDKKEKKRKKEKKKKNQIEKENNFDININNKYGLYIINYNYYNSKQK